MNLCFGSFTFDFAFGKQKKENSFACGKKKFQPNSDIKNSKQIPKNVHQALLGAPKKGGEN